MWNIIRHQLAAVIGSVALCGLVLVAAPGTARADTLPPCDATTKTCTPPCNATNKSCTPPCDATTKSCTPPCDATTKCETSSVTTKPATVSATPHRPHKHKHRHRH